MVLNVGRQNHAVADELAEDLPRDGRLAPEQSAPIVQTLPQLGALIGPRCFRHPVEVLKPRQHVRALLFPSPGLVYKRRKFTA